MFDHFSSKARVAFQLRRDGVERIEKKVRIELHAQHVQASLGKLTLKTFATEFAGKVSAVVLVGLPSADNEPIDEPAPEEHSAERVRKSLRIAQRRPGAKTEQGSICQENVNKQRSEKQAEKCVSSDSLEELRFRKRKAQVDGNNQRSEQPPGPPKGQRTEKRHAPAVRHVDVRQCEDAADH